MSTLNIQKSDNINKLSTNNNLNIPEKIEKISGLKNINMLDKQIDISLEERNIKKPEFGEYILSKFLVKLMAN